jgi:hypothetical protein
MRYFVWLPGLRGPEAQFWDEPDKTADGKPIKTLTKPIAVPDHINLSSYAAENPLPYDG